MWLWRGGGQIVREMALGSGRLDLGVHFRGAVYAVEVKTAALYAKSREKAYGQILRYMDRLGVSEGWFVGRRRSLKAVGRQDLVGRRSRRRQDDSSRVLLTTGLHSRSATSPYPCV